MRHLARLIIVLVLVTISGSLFAKSVSVKGYYRKNGTYVRPHTRNVQSSRSTNSRSRTKSKSYVSAYSDTSKSSKGTDSSFVESCDKNMSKSEETRRRLNAIDDALGKYHSKHGKWPESLVVLFKEPNTSIKFYDGWDKKFWYVQSEYGFRVSSAGEDGKYGTADDIKSPLSD